MFGVTITLGVVNKLTQREDDVIPGHKGQGIEILQRGGRGSNVIKWEHKGGTKCYNQSMFLIDANALMNWQ